MEKNRILLALVIIMLSTYLWAENNDTELKKITLTDTEQQLVNHNNAFALRLFKEARNEENMVLSPLSVTYAMGMLNNGAAGQTQQEICRMLGFGETGADSINNLCQKILLESQQLDEQTKVMIANTIFLNKGWTLFPSFVEKAQTYYDATPETCDFGDSKTPNIINQWASDHTEGMINEVVDEKSFFSNAACYLLNATYFKGTWTLKFNKDLTIEEPFNGGAALPMMSMQNELPYYQDENFEMLNLPYGNESYRMSILLPRQGKNIDDVLLRIDGEQWSNFSQLISMVSADVKLPRIETETKLDLKNIMQQLGITKAFSTTAEFPFLCTTPTYIDNIFQDVKIKLDEDGTEASAISVIEIDAGMPRSVKFHANRPFLYIISEQSTGIIFFIGQFMGNAVTNNIIPTQSVHSTQKKYYNLNGQQLNGKPARGLYIECSTDGKNGHKIIYK